MLSLETTCSRCLDPLGTRLLGGCISRLSRASSPETHIGVHPRSSACSHLPPTIHFTGHVVQCSTWTIGGCAGQGRMLGRRAAKLFAHIRDALQWAGLSSALGTDYSSVLRASLLAAPSYCAATPRDTFQGKLQNCPCLPPSIVPPGKACAWRCNRSSDQIIHGAMAQQATPR